MTATAPRRPLQLSYHRGPMPVAYQLTPAGLAALATDPSGDRKQERAGHAAQPRKPRRAAP